MDPVLQELSEKVRPLFFKIEKTNKSYGIPRPVSGSMFFWVKWMRCYISPDFFSKIFRNYSN